MNKIEQLENLLAGWEASYKLSMQKPDQTNEAICYGGVKALKDALKIFKRPSNTRMHVNIEPCGSSNMHTYYKHRPGYNFCPVCGKRL